MTCETGTTFAGVIAKQAASNRRHHAKQSACTGMHWLASHCKHDGCGLNGTVSHCRAVSEIVQSRIRYEALIFGAKLCIELSRATALNLQRSA